MPQTLAQGLEPAHCPVDFLGLCRETSPIEFDAALGREHGADLGEREARSLTQGDQGQLFQHHRCVLAASAWLVGRGVNEPLALVEPQRRGSNA